MPVRFQPFDLWDPTVEDFDFQNLARIEEIRRRWIDTHTWGIIRDNSYLPSVDIPVSAVNAAPNRKWVINQFPLRLDVVNGRLTIGLGASQSSSPPVYGGVAFDLNGERIAIPEDESFDFSNDSPYGKKSSGNLDIPMTLTGVTGTCLVNPAAPGTYYVWLEYLEINDPTPVVDENGVTYYPEILDGYRIRLTADPVPPSGDGVSIFMCKVGWFGGSGVLSIVNGRATDGTNFIDTAPTTTGDPNRAFCGIRDNVVEISVDSSAKPTVYQEGSFLTVREHINAVGGGTPTPENPHGLTLADIPGAGEEPVATNNQNDSLAKGIVDLNAAQNSPASNGDALQPTIEQTVLSPIATLDPAAVSNGITSSPKDAWLRIKDLDNQTKTKSVFLGGLRLKQIYPTLRQTTDHASDPSIIPSDPDSGDGWVGFNNSEDTPGVYRIYGLTVVLASGDNALLLNKELMPGWPAVIPDLDETRILIGQVYWDGLDVFRNPVQQPTSDPVANQPDDQRSLGLVGPQQISTEAKSDPNTGSLSAQVFENQTANSAYTLGLLNVTENGLGVSSVIPVGGGGQPAVITAGTDPTMASGGPGAVTALRFTTNAGGAGSLAISRIYHLLKNLKPDRFYGFSFWYKADSAFNVRARFGLSDGAGAFSTPNSLMTLDGATAVGPLDVTIKNDGLWHRASLVVKTLPSVDPDPTVAKYLQMRFEQGANATVAGQFTITNLQVTEGEWIPGYMGSKYVPSGAILLWDQSTSCPPGYQEVTDAQGRFAVGKSSAIPVGTSSVTQLDPGSPGIATSAVGNHDHTVNNSADAGGIGTSFVQAQTTSANGGHSHTLDANLPYYSVLFCRAI